MSSFTVSPAHIHVLVNAAAHYGVMPTTTPAMTRRTLTATGQMLMRHNHHAAHGPTSDTDPCAGDGGCPAPRYRLHTTDAPLEPLAVLKALDCYVYQTAGHPDWATSPAAAFSTELRQAVHARHPDLHRDHYRYDQLPWHITDLTQATRPPDPTPPATS